jgi:hypothetical protein
LIWEGGWNMAAIPIWVSSFRISNYWHKIRVLWVWDRASFSLRTRADFCTCCASLMTARLLSKSHMLNSELENTCNSNYISRGRVLNLMLSLTISFTNKYPLSCLLSKNYNRLSILKQWWKEIDSKEDHYTFNVFSTDVRRIFLSS